MAPQFTAMYFPCFLCDKEWIIRGMLSFPTPLSPVTNTEISVGATLIAFSKARFNFESLPIISKRCFTAWIDILLTLIIFYLITVGFCYILLLSRSEEHTSELQ